VLQQNRLPTQQQETAQQHCIGIVHYSSATQDTQGQGMFYPDYPQILWLIKCRKDPRDPATPKTENRLWPLPLLREQGLEAQLSTLAAVCP